MACRLLPWLAVTILLIGCSEEAPPDELGAGPSDANVHSDDDGLSDEEERLWGTSPISRDTDGDGFTDAEEINEYNFRPNVDPHKFNPLIADVPRIEIKLKSPPKVTVEFRRSEGSSESVENGRTKDTATTVSTSNTSSESVSNEVSVSDTLSATVGSEVSFEPKISSSITASRTESWSQSNESSFSWSRSQSRENRLALSEMRSRSRNTDLTMEGGHVKVLVSIANTGHLAFKIQTLSLAAVRVVGTRELPVAQLELASERPFHALGTWGAGDKPVKLTFQVRGLSLPEVEDLLDGGLVIRPGKYELLDEKEGAYKMRSTGINAKCARVIVEYGGDRATESYLVSTYDPDGGDGTTLARIMRDILRIPCVTGSIGWVYPKDPARPDAPTLRETPPGVVKVRDVAADPKKGGFWLVTHEQKTGPGKYETYRYHILHEGYSLEQIRVFPENVVRFVYIEDPDRDGLGNRSESLYGTDPWNKDTDGDGRLDGLEVREGTNPLFDDRDALPHVARATARSAGREATLRFAVADGDGDPVTRVDVDWGDGSPVEKIANPKGELRRRHTYPKLGAYKIRITPYAAPGFPGKGRTLDLKAAPVLVHAWTRLIGGKGDERPAAIGVDRQGHVYIAGTVRGEHSIEQYARRGRRFLVCYDARGERQWVRQAGSATENAGNTALAVAPDGTVYHVCDEDLVVTVRGRGRRGRSTRRQKRLVLRVCDRNGKDLWKAALDTPENETISQVVVTAKGDVFLAGTTNGTFPKNKARKRGTKTAFVARYTKRKLAWVKQFDAVAITGLSPHGEGVYATGLIDMKQANYFVMAVDANGNVPKLDTVTPKPRAFALGLPVAGHGLMYMVGLTNERTPDKPNRGGVDVVVYGFEKNTQRWARSFGTRLADVAAHAAVRPGPPGAPGPLYVVGASPGDLLNETADVPPDAAKRSRGFLAVYGFDGERRAILQFGDGDQTRARAVAVDRNGAVYVVGATMGTLGQKYTNKGKSDVFVMKFEPGK